jgi:endonuclease-3 related protein
MLALPRARLESLLRPSGFFRVKAARLRALLRWIVGRGGDAAAALRGDPRALREELLAVHGVGRETADSLLLYAAGHPVFVIDAYTRRVAGRHGWRDPREDYDDMRAWFESGLPRDPRVYNELHAEVVAVGKEHCRPAPRCDGCPLEPLLPRGGPLAPRDPATGRAARRAGDATTRGGGTGRGRSRAR